MENKEIDIEIQEDLSAENSGTQLPLNFLTFGEIENDDVKVYIKQNVYKALEKFAASDTSKELGSIVIGSYAEELGKIHVVISDYIEAKYTDASASTLTFTHETWDYIHKEHERLYADKKIIGWQHTHPNYGIFLSNYDMFIQENFFNMPFQVAYVIDPIQDIRGFFQWKNGKVEKLKGFYIYDDVGKPIKIEKQKIKTEKAPAKKSGMLISAVSVLCVLCLILTGALFTIRSSYQRQLENQRAIIENQSDEISELQSIFSADLFTSSGTTTAEELIERLEEADTNSDSKDRLLAELKAIVEENKDLGAVQFKAYNVQQGDSLYSICAENQIDYASNIKLILTINGIENGNRIYVGQTILLPTTKK